MKSLCFRNYCLYTLCIISASFIYARDFFQTTFENTTDFAIEMGSYTSGAFSLRGYIAAHQKVPFVLEANTMHIVRYLDKPSISTMFIPFATDTYIKAVGTRNNITVQK